MLNEERKKKEFKGFCKIHMKWKKNWMRVNMVHHSSFWHVITLGCVQNWFYCHNDKAFSYSNWKNNKYVQTCFSCYNIYYNLSKLHLATFSFESQNSFGPIVLVVLQITKWEPLIWSLMCANLPINSMVILLYPQSRDNQDQETFLVPSTDKQTCKNYLKKNV